MRSALASSLSLGTCEPAAAGDPSSAAGRGRAAAAPQGGYGHFGVETYFLHDVDTTWLVDDQNDENEAALLGATWTFPKPLEERLHNETNKFR